MSDASKTTEQDDTPQLTDSMQAALADMAQLNPHHDADLKLARHFFLETEKVLSAMRHRVCVRRTFGSGKK
jgi:hypothetical protein